MVIRPEMSRNTVRVGLVRLVMATMTPPCSQTKRRLVSPGADAMQTGLANERVGNALVDLNAGSWALAGIWPIHAASKTRMQVQIRQGDVFIEAFRSGIQHEPSQHTSASLCCGGCALVALK